MLVSTKKRVKESEMNMTPMIDVVFLLITFFMVVTEITRQDDIEDLQLPDVRAAIPDETADPQRLIINIAADGTVYIGGKPYDITRDPGASTVRGKLSFEATLSRTDTGAANRVVLVRSDRRVKFQYVKRIMEMCVREGIWRLAFGTLPFDTKVQKQSATAKLGGS